MHTLYSRGHQDHSEHISLPGVLYKVALAYGTGDEILVSEDHNSR